MKLESIVLFVTTVELIRTNLLSINEMTNKGFMNNNNNKVKKIFFLLSNFTIFKCFGYKRKNRVRIK